MANEFLSQLGRQAPHIALAFLAARKGGPMALAALEGGMAQAQQRQEALARQAQLDEERRAQQAAQEARLANADTREQEQADLQRTKTLMDALATYDADPNALASLYGVPQEKVAPLMPAVVSRKDKQRAKEIVERASKDQKFAGYFQSEEGLAELDNTTMPWKEGSIKFGELRRIAEEPQIPPKLAKPKQEALRPETRSLDVQAAEALAKGDTDTYNRLLKVKKEMGQADDRPRDPVLAELAQMRLEQQRNAPQLPPATQRRVDSLVKGFDAQPAVKNAQKMAESVSFANSLDINTKNPADDQGLIYAFAKAMDPDSVVREGEYATVQKYAQSWAERFGFNAARIFSNTQFLTSQARANMKATITAKFKAGQGQYENLRKSYADRINKITGAADGDTYLTDYGGAFPGNDPASTARDKLNRR